MSVLGGDWSILLIWYMYCGGQYASTQCTCKINDCTTIITNPVHVHNIGLHIHVHCIYMYMYMYMYIRSYTHVHVLVDSLTYSRLHQTCLLKIQTANPLYVLTVTWTWNFVCFDQPQLFCEHFAICQSGKDACNLLNTSIHCELRFSFSYVVYTSNQSVWCCWFELNLNMVVYNV